jgi:probable F420-dependent oxidoreductase
MSIELGKVGIWRHPSGLTPEVVAEVEALGYGTIWVGGSPPGDLAFVEHLLDTTQHIAVTTGIVNVWKDDAATVGASYHRVTTRHPGRFLLGLGIGHPEATDEYQQPYAALVSYLDQLDDLKVPVEGRVLAALGPRVLRLSAERAAGAHPYLVTPEHTPGRSSATGRCSPRSRSWSWRPTRSGPAPSAARGCRTRISA